MNIRLLLKNNDFGQAILFLEKFEGDSTSLNNLLLKLQEEYGLLLLTLLKDIAYRRNIVFWYVEIGKLLVFHYHYLEGGQASAYFYFSKAHRLAPDNLVILEALLDFYEPPEVILSLNEAQILAQKILKLDADNKKALKIMSF